MFCLDNANDASANDTVILISNVELDQTEVIVKGAEYKLKQQKRLESLAKRVAREVSKTKIDAKLDPMNSYERRIVHTTLQERDDVTTESTGEGEKRHVVVKPTFKR